MTTSTIAFVPQQWRMRKVPVNGAYTFKPTGKSKFLQEIAWRFLQWCDSLKPHMEETFTATHHTIDADSFMERIIKQKHNLYDGYGKIGKRLLIGSGDYCELMNDMTAKGQYFEFGANLHFATVGRRELLGLTVEVIPWMRGVVVMP